MLPRTIHRWAVRFGIASGFRIQPPPGWIKVTSRLNPFPEYRSPDDRAHIRITAFQHGAWATLARFEHAHLGEGSHVDRRSDDRLSTGIPVVRIENTRPDDRSGITYEWMDVLAIIDTRPLLFTLRSLPPLEAAVIAAFDTMISSYRSDY